MTKITQADREAAAAFYGTWGATKGWQHLEEPIRKGLVDDNALVQAFARHRHQARAEVVGEIVAWLRIQDDPSEKWALQNSHWYADEIEAGEHLK